MSMSLPTTPREPDLEAESAFLTLENAFLQQLLQRVAPSLLHGDTAAAAAVDGTGREPLLLAEKQELCAAEAAASRREMERVQAEGELELACAQAGVADARGQQAAETARDLVTVLELLGLPAPAPVAAVAEAAAAVAAAVSAATRAEPALAADAGTEGQGEAEQAPVVGEASQASTASRAAPAVAGLALPSTRQLSRADLHGGRLAQFLEAVLARHADATQRLHTRNMMLQNQLARLEASLGQRAELGAALRKVDFDALRIEHSQAEAALAAAAAEAVALKSQVAAAAQQLAEQRSALASTAADSAALVRQAEVRQGQAAVLQADAAKAQRERSALASECQQLRGHSSGGAAAGDSGTRGSTAGSKGAASVPAGGVEGEGQATILEYMRVKNACAEASKRIADWQRKLEVQAGRRAAVGRGQLC